MSAQPPQRDVVAVAPDGHLETRQEIIQKGDSLFDSQFVIDEHAAEIAVPSAAARNTSPVDFGNFLMQLTELADRASEHGQPLLAAKYYRAVAKAVPEVSVGFVKLCEVYEVAGDHQRAVESCAAALSRKGVTLADYQRYVHLVVEDHGELIPSRVDDLDRVIAHVDAQLGDASPVAAQLRCDVGVRLMNEQRLSECTRVLSARWPNEAKTLSYQWTLALVRHDYAGAEQLIERVRHSDIKPGAVAIMQEITRDASSPAARFRAALAPLDRREVVLGLGLGALLAIGLYFTLRHRRSLASSSTI